MQLIEKIKNAIKEKRFWRLVKIKLKNARPLYNIQNNIVKNLQWECKEYKRIKRKYSYVLDRKEQYGNKESSNKVWILWLQGLDNAPSLVKKCIASIKENLKDREIIILNLDNYKEYVELPNYIIQKFEKGIIPFAHFSDILRISLLSQNGGIWLDATVLLTGEIPEYITESELFVFKNIELDKSDKNPIVASSWLISANSNNNIINLTKELLYEYWKHEKTLYNYFLFHIFFTIATEKYSDEWKKVPTYSNANPHILQFELLEKYDEKRFNEILRISSIHKLSRTIKNDNKNVYTFYDYIIDNM